MATIFKIGMRTFFLIIKLSGLRRGVIYIFDSIMHFFSKVFYHFVIYKRSIHSSIFDVISFAKNEGVELNKTRGEYLINFEINEKEVKAVLRDRTSDIAVFREIFILGEYQEIVNKIDSRSITINSIIDIGANVGLALLYFHKYFPNAGLIAVEPDEQNTYQITKNCKLNGLKNWKLEVAGIWSHEASLSVTKKFRHGDSWSLNVEEDTANGNVKGITVDALLMKHELASIDLLKIDIEGAEALLFKHHDQCKFLERTKFICVETHLEVGSMSIVVNALARYDFDLSFKGDVIFGFNRNHI